MSEFTQVEAEIQKCEEVIAFAAVAEKLQKNKEFKKVVEEDYFDSELKRMVKALAKVNKEQREEIFARILGISFAMEQFDSPTVFAKIAKQNLEELKETRSNILTEGE